MNRLHPRHGIAHDRTILLLTLAAAIAGGCQHIQNEVGERPNSDAGNFGFGLDERSFATSGIETATAADLDGSKVGHVAELIEGRFPGVHVERTARGDYSVRIRGVSTFYGDTEPLWVVDGLAIAPEAGGVSWINPADVARIDVLKDVSSTAMYGVRGRNGVILVTTKRGR